MTAALLDARSVRSHLDDFLGRLGRFEMKLTAPGEVGVDTIAAFTHICEEVEAFLLALSVEERSALDPQMIDRLRQGLSSAQKALSARIKMISVVKDAVRYALSERVKPQAYGANGRMRAARAGVLGETVA
jgi:hypothetical protein